MGVKQYLEVRVKFSWRQLPETVALPLLKGSVGVAHLTSIAEAALHEAAGKPEEGSRLLQLAGQALLAAWESDPLNSGAAAQLLHVHRVSPFLNRAAAALAETANAISPPENPEEMERLRACLMARDTEESLRYLGRRLRHEPGNPFWIRQGAWVGMAEERLDWTERLLSKADILPAPLREGLLADVEFARGAWRAARGRYLSALRAMPSPVWRERLGETFLREGLVDEALAQWDVVLTQRPWHANLLLRRDDVIHGRHLPGEHPAGQGAVLLYTWNKAEHLNATLESLAASDLGQARLVVLDNGSADATPQVIAAWAQRLGPRLDRVRLPCNIGAPAARNWLLAMPENRACDWAAFVDDDVELPRDWLRLLGRAMRERPGHAVYGCRVVNHDTPMTVQSADMHLEPGGPSGSSEGGVMGQEPAHIRRFSVSGIHHQTLDFGDFSYLRPCVSVTGCCHLFRMEALDAVGHFDLRFSPSQYDDLEHDVRHALRGQWPVYQGHLRVRHMKNSGRAAWADSAGMLCAWANLFKLQMRYTQEEYDALRRAEHEMLLADMLARDDTIGTSRAHESRT